MIYQNRKVELKKQVDEKIKSELKTKPSINKKSISLLNLKINLQKQLAAASSNNYCMNNAGPIATNEYTPNFVHNHENCYISRKQVDDMK